MKKLIGLLSLMTIASFGANAATQGNVQISGTVAPVLSLSLDAASYTSLNIITGGDHTVANATEESNDLDGYKILAYSTNGSELKKDGTSNTYKTSYTIKYDGGSAQTLPAPGSEVELKDSGALTGLTTDTSSVIINVTAYPTAPQGVYSDTVYLKIQAN